MERFDISKSSKLMAVENYIGNPWRLAKETSYLKQCFSQSHLPLSGSLSWAKLPNSPPVNPHFESRDSYKIARYGPEDPAASCTLYPSFRARSRRKTRKRQKGYAQLCVQLCCHGEYAFDISPRSGLFSPPLPSYMPTSSLCQEAQRARRLPQTPTQTVAFILF